MPFPWAIAAQVVKAAATAYQEYANAGSDAQERERLRESIIVAITQMRNEVIAEVISLRLSELEGQVAGFETTYAAYDPDPDNPVEENRLVRLIDDAALVLGELGRLVDMVRAEPDVGLAAWPPYLSLLYLRSQAMTEREVTYDADEIKDILPTVEEALQRMQGVQQYFRDMSDARFGSVVTRRHPDFTAPIVGYMFEHHFMPCGYANDPDVIQRANDLRDRHMDSAYAVYEGVPETHEAIAELQATIDDLSQTSFLNRLAVLGPDIRKKVIRLEDGRMAFRGGLPIFTARRRSSRAKEAA
jgi:hypothetical protein